jgi:putative membrane protein
MTILRWVLLTALAIAFLLLAVANWTPVPFRMPDGVIVSVQLPVLLAVAFLAGWLPTWLILLGTRAQLRRRLARYERAGDAGVAVARTPLPSQAQPTIVPPAGA